MTAIDDHYADTKQAMEGIANYLHDYYKREYPDVPWPNVDPADYLAHDAYRSLIDCHHARDSREPRRHIRLY